ncbi:MAG: XRE family transcriptional regulator [Balneolaceae bacterium]|nr:MAG: XRE family transcriptional regulator [Balneolaceae bacterium]
MPLFYTPKEVSDDIAGRAKQRRLQLNITQKELAERSGVSFGSVKRFEQKGEVSLKNLLQIAVVLRSLDEFSKLFQPESYRTIDEMLEQKKTTVRERARSDHS